MAWSNVGSLKGPKGDVGEASGGIPQGAIVLVYNKSPSFNAMYGSSEWQFVGSSAIWVDHPAYDTSGNPTPNDTSSGKRTFILFAKA